MLANWLKAASSGGLNVAALFSADLWTGDGSTTTVVNGINLTNGGMLWIRGRTNPAAVTSGLKPRIFDTERVSGNNDYWLEASESGVDLGGDANYLTYNPNGYTLSTNDNWGANTNTYVGWAFRKAKRFFDIVTYTGNGTTQTISHSLGVTPGMIIVKNRDATDAWYVFNRGMSSPETKALLLDRTSGSNTSTNFWNDTSPTSTQFTVGSLINSSGEDYVAYLFAHDTSGVIQCGGFTADGSGNADVNHGWTQGTQFVLLRNIGSGAWEYYDTQRTPSWTGDDAMVDGEQAAETTIARLSETGTTLSFSNLSVSQQYIYMIIRAKA